MSILQLLKKIIGILKAEAAKNRREKT